MLNFSVNKKTCTVCGLCVADCPANIITLASEGPAIPPENEVRCYRCQHCLAVCPTGSISILGVQPEACRPLAGHLPSADQVETLIRGRRTVRRYKDENLSPRIIQRLLDVTAQAPSGRNERKVLLTVIDDRKVMADFRQQTMDALARLVRDKKLPAGRERFADIVAAWENKGVDIIFRGAPHFLVASAPRTCATPAADCFIALSYFELFARSMGVGTLWDGLAYWALMELVPDVQTKLAIPEDHQIGYMMLFGKPDVEYFRGVRHEPAQIARVH